MTRDDVPRAISALIQDRPVRWEHGGAARQSTGPTDGAWTALSIFLVEDDQRIAVMRAVQPLRTDIENAAGGPVVFLLHDVDASWRTDGDFLRGWPTLPPPADTAPAS